MKIAFVSGFLNNHLLPLCLELAKKNEFYFIATEKANYTAYNRETIITDFVVNYFEEKNKETACEIIKTCDVAIFGGNSDELLSIRKKTGKLSFIYTERFLKKGTWRKFLPSTAKILHERFITNNENLYVLCAGSYVKNDLEAIGFNTDNCFKFGYFPLVEPVDLNSVIIQKNHPIPKFLYVGRMLNWKRIKDIVKCCHILQNNNIPIEMNIVGDGPENKNLKKTCQKLQLTNINFLGIKTSKEVFDLMRESNALIISSNRFEGWGAVVNEALSNCCPVIASNTCGSTAYLIKNGENGYCYKSANIKNLYSVILNFINNQNKEQLYFNALSTIENEWNAKIAAERFLKISQALIENTNANLYSSGPLSIEKTF